VAGATRLVGRKEELSRIQCSRLFPTVKLRRWARRIKTGVSIVSRVVSAFA